MSKAKSPKEKSAEMKRLSDAINTHIHNSVYEGTIRDWKDIEWNKILRRQDLSKVLKALEGQDAS